MQESDAFDDDSDHWGTVDDDQPAADPHEDCDCWRQALFGLVLVLALVLFVVWAGVLTFD